MLLRLTCHAARLLFIYADTTAITALMQERGKPRYGLMLFADITMMRRRDAPRRQRQTCRAADAPLFDVLPFCHAARLLMRSEERATRQMR